MRGLRTLVIGGWMLATAGCGRDEHRGYNQRPDEAPARTAQAPQPAPPAPPPAARLATAADSAQARTRIAADSTRVAAAFAKATRLTAREVGNLRLDKNARQIATARTLGRRVSGQGEIRTLLRNGEFVELGDSTRHWILRDMDHSVPYVTPDARALLEEVGRRFHARLDRLGLPRYRLKVTSALRTDETQADLRKINSYASRTVSAHEFGTTMDVSHERFAAPAPDRSRPGWELEMEMLDDLAKEHARVLQAELGRTLLEMRESGALHVMMENRQPVYHFTVARRLAGANAAR